MPCSENTAAMDADIRVYAAYKSYYPDKWAAISALRRETGMDFDQANAVVNALFGVSDDDERKADDAQQEQIYQEMLKNEGTSKRKNAFLETLSAFFHPKKK